MSQPFTDEVAARIADALKTRGLELCQAAWKPTKKRAVLTLTIDKPGGVSLADCESASHVAEELLDGLDVPDVPYRLDVESPGLDRPLFSLADCARFRGKRVTVRLNVKVEGASKLKGILENVDGDALTVLDEDQHRRYTVRFGDVKLARLVPEL